ncbi:Cro/CI family transcriptional regulator [Ectopseudomonas khazarica]|uniref:Cro/CI family transcriptional regulator n=1 Tax=Ectopseudomonas khazarica TaxID=2502979 RepID=UPI00403389F5
MIETSLQSFVEGRGQSEAARLLGVTAPAIHKALAANRDIRVVELPDGSFSAGELRPFPSQRKSKAA